MKKKVSRIALWVFFNLWSFLMSDGTVDMNLGPGKVLSIPIFHKMHEGSHAIGQALAGISCTFFVEEFLDIRYFENNNSEMQKAEREFTSADGVDLQKLNSLIKIKAFQPDYKLYSKCIERGVITSVVGLVRRFEHRPVKMTSPAFVLIRSDIMRFSLSLARQDFHEFYPQFNKSFILTPRHYNISSLRKYALEVIEGWKSRSQRIQQIRKVYGVSCDRIKIIIYEDFLRDPSTLINNMYSFAIKGLSGISGLNDSMKNEWPGHRSNYTKVHPVNIRSFVLNADEVEKHFADENYINFLKILKLNPNIGCDIEKLLIRV